MRKTRLRSIPGFEDGKGLGGKEWQRPLEVENTRYKIVP